MFFSRTTFIGIDPSAGRRPFFYSALDNDLRMLALGQGNLEDMLAFAAGQRQAFVAVSAPRRPNLGLMTQEDVRQQLSPAPHPGRWQDLRMAEYLLRQHNIPIPQTRSMEMASPNWVRMGFTLFRRLDSLGYQSCPSGEAERQSLEVYPHACYAALLGFNPFPKHTLEGRLQRQLVLHEQKINVPDPMRFFEEITRHRLLKGILPYENLYSPEELDALIGAYTAWFIANHPDQALLLGDPLEGQIVLPVPELKQHY